MATVYKPYVGERVGANGVSAWLDSGEEVSFDGRTLVRVADCVIVDNRDQWFETREEAWAKARELVLAAANRLVAQAATLGEMK